MPLGLTHTGACRVGLRARGAGPLGPEYGGPEPWATSSPGMSPNELGGRHVGADWHCWRGTEFL